MSEKKQTKKKEKIRFSSDREGVKIVKVAAFCLAIVSWFATADGLYSYVFTENYTEALLISFGIQSILFVFNLKLPAYFSMIGDKAPDNEKTHRKYMFGRRKGEDKNTYRWLFRQKIIALLYVILIFASSWFSFVYISDFAYSKTRYIDANVELENTYRNSLSQVDKYINELTKCDLLIMDKRISVLQQYIKEDSKISRNDLITRLDRAQADYDEKDTIVKQKEDELDAAKAVLNSKERRTEKKREEQESKVKRLSNTLANKRKDRNKAKQTLEQAQRDLDNYKPPVNDIIHDFLVKITKQERDSTELSDLLSDITDRAIQYDTTNSNYVDVVVSLEEFKIITNDYLLLRQLQSEDSANNIIKLRDELIEDEIVLPTPNSNDFLKTKSAWETTWKKRFISLDSIIDSLPSFSPESIENYKDIKDVVDTSFLDSFDSSTLSRENKKVTRRYLSEINVMERSVLLLFNGYPLLAWFSLLFAIFLDTSSLLAGLFVYYVKLSKTVKTS